MCVCVCLIDSEKTFRTFEQFVVEGISRKTWWAHLHSSSSSAYILLSSSIVWFDFKYSVQTEAQILSFIAIRVDFYVNNQWCTIFYWYFDVKVKFETPLVFYPVFGHFCRIDLIIIVRLHYLRFNHLHGYF